MLVDVLHVEDKEEFAKCTRRIVESMGLNYVCVGFLDELRDYLVQRNYAKRFLVDGGFPRTKEGKPEMLFPEALGLIRSFDSSAKITLLSLMSNNDGLAIAEAYKIGFMNKSDLMNPEILKKILNS